MASTERSYFAVPYVERVFLESGHRGRVFLLVSPGRPAGLLPLPLRLVFFSRHGLSIALQCDRGAFLILMLMQLQVPLPCTGYGGL